MTLRTSSFEYVLITLTATSWPRYSPFHTFALPCTLDRYTDRREGGTGGLSEGVHDGHKSYTTIRGIAFGSRAKDRARAEPSQPNAVIKFGCANERRQTIAERTLSIASMSICAPPAEKKWIILPSLSLERIASTIKEGNSCRSNPLRTKRRK